MGFARGADCLPPKPAFSVRMTIAISGLSRGAKVMSQA
jgi:hypothetical protein